jgi:cysteinyl-tRNA synthetase
MAHKYLGAAFDIHGGGLDLVFPHHENEIAHSKAAGDGFASYWLHNYWVTTSGEKMSKSLGNSLLVSEVIKRVRPIELRYYLVASHYRSHMEFSEDALQEAGAGFRRLESFVRNATQRVGATDPGIVCADFERAMDGDFGVPAALAAIHEVATDGNKALAAGDDAATRGALASVRAMLGILGVDPMADTWADREGAGSDLHDVVDALVTAQLAARQEARANKDFTTADAIRDSLTAAGIAIDDTAEGARWSLLEEN